MSYKWLVNILKKTDIFGISFSFMINRQTQYRTSFGGVLSILIAVVIIIFFAYYLFDLFERQRFTFYFLDIISPTYMDTFNISDLGLGFALENSEGMELNDERLMKLNIYQVNGTDSTAVILEQNLEERDYERRKKNFSTIQSQIMNITLDSHRIKGASFLTITLELCKNETKTGDLCYSQDEMKKKLSSSFLVFSGKKLKLDLKVYQTPFEAFFDYEKFPLSGSIRKDVDVYFKNVYFYSDNNGFYVNYIKTRYLQLDYFHETYSHDFSSIIFQMTILRSQKEQSIYRQYIKISQAFVNLGGLISTLFTAGGVITNYINYIRMKLFIMNRLFDFRDTKDVKRKSVAYGNLMNRLFKNLPITLDDQKGMIHDLKGNGFANPTHSARENEGLMQNNINQNDYTTNIPLINVNIDRNITSTENKKLNKTVIEETYPAESSFLSKEKLSNMIKFRFPTEKDENNFSAKAKNKAINNRPGINQSPETGAKQDQIEPKGEASKYLMNEENMKLVQEMIKFEKRRNKSFTLNYSELFKMLLCNCCKKNEDMSKITLYEKAEKLMSTTFDVVEVYRQLEKMNRFISFCLTEKQEILLNFMGRPKVNLKTVTTDKNEKKMINLIDCYQAYIELKKNSSNYINAKLLENMDGHLLTAFSNMNNK